MKKPPLDLNPDALELIKTMLEKNSKQRATIEAVSSHPFLRWDGLQEWGSIADFIYNMDHGVWTSKYFDYMYD